MHLERLILILEITGQLDEVTVTDICTRSDMPKPTVYRLVHDLVGAGLLDTVAQGRFALGARLKRITQSDQSDAVLLDLMAPVLRRAATEHGAAFFLSRLRGRAVEIIHVETPDTGVAFLHPGLGRRPVHACSCSKAIAAVSPEPLAKSIDGRMKAYTEFTHTRIQELTAELDLIRQRGYATCVEEIERGMCSVAAPLSDTGPGTAFAIGATGSTRVFTPAFRDRIGHELIRLARQQANILGWLAAPTSKAPPDPPGLDDAAPRTRRRRKSA